MEWLFQPIAKWHIYLILKCQVHPGWNLNMSNDHKYLVLRVDFINAFNLIFFSHLYEFNCILFQWKCENLGIMVMIMTFDFWCRMTFDLDNIFGNFEKWPALVFISSVWQQCFFFNIAHWSSVMNRSWST